VRASLLLALAVFCAEAPKPTAAPEPQPPAPVVKRSKELPGETVEFKTADGWTIAGQFQPPGKDQLTFILLHESGGRRQNWYYLAKHMAVRGIGYLAVDLRGHGQSQKPPDGQPAEWRKFKVGKDYNEYDNMREDIAAAAAFLTENGIEPEVVALAGAAVGGSVALRYAALHPEIAQVCLLSPGMSHQSLPTVNALRAFKDRPILLVMGDDDRRTAAEAPILFEFAKRAVGPENVQLVRVPRGHGTRMLYYNKGLIDQVLDWMENPIQPPDLTTELSTGTAPAATPEPAPAPEPKREFIR
jgi:pimeloyl-ACP methyl ester carboxylesterase